MTELRELRELHERRERLIGDRATYIKPGYDLKLTRHQRRVRDRLTRSIERLDAQIALKTEADGG